MPFDRLGIDWPIIIGVIVCVTSLVWFIAQFERLPRWTRWSLIGGAALFELVFQLSLR